MSSNWIGSDRNSLPENDEEETMSGVLLMEEHVERWEEELTGRSVKGK